MIFLWLILEFLAISIFIDAVKIYKHQDSLVMIFFIVVSGFLMIYTNFIFLEENIFEAILFQVYIMVKAGSSELKPKTYITKKPNLYLSIYIYSWIKFLFYFHIVNWIKRNYDKRLSFSIFLFYIINEKGFTSTI